ncbi:hypothetical protein PPL_05683 [Heterostelium album PN500]|uniref:Ima1 N-terminal domain-containing protein n=1 Tax=Heterostelium pallidum (strain ATCC 26659 / Pp 5 / PN500) TaxID=670386 RepID=D3BAV2_HETP5|nr:hypothetical protein PPL_05683 [Heterostelium album PN500]EFA81689.1 hypothetical protein PPL_05683 [Heterostelium album PN500]|eukprot:XP_020433806.1 hypothetical protein PPL_05683 [Heterostelium album PN500]
MENYQTLVERAKDNIVLVEITLIVLVFAVWILKPLILNLIDPFRLVDIRCHFCLSYNKIPLNYRNEWTCTTCEQYNGFNKDGGYNAMFKNQHLDLLNHELQKNSSNNNNSSSSNRIGINSKVDNIILCTKCQFNLQTKNNDLQMFDPVSDDNRLFRNYQDDREKQFKLCEQCEFLVSSEISRINRYIVSTQYNNQYLPVSSQYSKSYSTAPYSAKTTKTTRQLPLFSLVSSLSNLTTFFNFTIYTIIIVFAIGNLLKIIHRLERIRNSVIVINSTITNSSSSNIISSNSSSNINSSNINQSPTSSRSRNIIKNGIDHNNSTDNKYSYNIQDNRINITKKAPFQVDFTSDTDLLAVTFNSKDESKIAHRISKLELSDGEEQQSSDNISIDSEGKTIQSKLSSTFEYIFSASSNRFYQILRSLSNYKQFIIGFTLCLIIQYIIFNKSSIKH